MVVQWELITVDDLKSSCFGCPPPRHGLQLLFWFANECVLLREDNRGQGVIMELVAECQPERGDYGFHAFRDIEKTLLRGRCKKNKKGAYFGVGNINPLSYPAADNLPHYVKGNHGLRVPRRYYNMDRVIIRYDTRTKVVDMVYVTEHVASDVSSKFSPERTHMISPELIRTLQDTQLDVFLILAGYYDNLGHGGDIVQTLHQQQQPSAVQYIGSDDSIYGSSIQSQQTDRFKMRYFIINPAWSEYNQQIANSNMSYREQLTEFLRGIMTSNFSQRVGDLFGSFGNSQHAAALEQIYGSSSVYSQRQDYVRSPAITGTTGSSWGFSARERGSERESEDDDRKWRGRAMVLGKVLLVAGALYLGVKCLSWLSGGGAGKHLYSTSVKTAVPFRRPYVFHDIPIMLFYAF